MKALATIALLDVGAAVAALGPRSVHFADETARQDYPGFAHRGTATIYLRAPKAVTLNSMLADLEVVHWPALAEPAFAALLAKVGDAVGPLMARAMIVRLMPGRSVLPHRDIGPYAEATERYHLPLNTNGEAWLCCGAERRHVPKGELVYFDKHHRHAAGNDGLEPRDHLIVDFWREGARAL